MVLGVATLAGVGALLVWDAMPDKFPAGAHDILSALPLASIGVVWIIHRLSQRSPTTVMLKAGILTAAFLFWAANQLWPDSLHATVLNDAAVALFVLDVCLAIRERPRETPSSEGEL